jgi:hypothetical protein
VEIGKRRAREEKELTATTEVTPESLPKAGASILTALPAHLNRPGGAIDKRAPGWAVCMGEKYWTSVISCAQPVKDGIENSTQ